MPRADRRGQPADQRASSGLPTTRWSRPGGPTRRSRAASAPGPLHGVPFTIKDSLDTAGVVTTAGTVGWRDRVPERDATVVARLRAAGGILLGKTNTPEFTWANETDNDVYGRTSNPYDLDRTPGGSSGGAAAIVAAGGAPFDIGSDSGNSIRQPAHLCGVAGIKPTSGRVPRTGHWPGFEGLFESFTQLGPIARRVEDLELVLPIIAGPDGEDPHVVPAPLGDPATVDVGAAAGRLVRRQRDPDADARDDRPRSQAAVAAIAATGAHRRGAGAARHRRGAAGLGGPHPRGRLRLAVAAHRAGRDARSRLVRHVRLGHASPRRARRRRRADRGGRARRRRPRRASSAGCGRSTSLVCPVLPLPALRHGESRTPAYGDTYSEIHNLTGWPAAVVRAGTSPEGLPIGVQLVAKPWREDVRLAAARVVEAATGGWQAPAL